METQTSVGARVRAIEIEDLPFMQTVMRNHLEASFFASLGSRFLNEYLRTYATSPSGCALIAEQGGRPVGFLVGSVDAFAHRRYILQAERWRLLVLGACGLLLRPAVAMRFLRTRFRTYAAKVGKSGGGGAASTRAEQGAPGVLAHVAMVPGARNCGLGRQLLDRFESVCRAHGTTRAELVVRESNVKARRFYARSGWAEIRVKTDPDGISWVTMKANL